MKQSTERRFDLDWLRVLGVLLLVPFHVALIFVLDPDSIMYIKDVVNSPILDEAAGFVHLWHMPLLFIISGAATYFALRRRSAGEYLRERFLRLLVPFMVGVLTFVPLTTSIRHLGDRTLLAHYTGFFNLDLNHLDGYNGTFTPAHLWFILFLFVFSLVGLPLFIVLLARKPREIQPPLARLMHSPLGLILMGIPLTLVAALDILGDKNPLYYFTIFLYGFVLASDRAFQQSIDRLIWFALGYGFFEAVFRVVVPQGHYEDGTMPWMAFGLMYEMGRWMLTLAGLGLGHRYLNHTNRFLRYANEAAMPFYLLHMTFSVAVGYFVIQLNAPVAVKYPLIVVLATGLTLVAYELVRRWNVTRWMLGMRQVKKSAPLPTTAELEQQAL